jgi:hypothetical protein
MKDVRVADVTEKEDGTDVVQTYVRHLINLYNYMWLCIMRTLIMEHEYPCF